MSRVVVIAGADPGHALPAIGLGGALARHGHRVRLLCGAEQATTAERYGLRSEPLPALPLDARDADIGHRLWGRAAPLATRLVDTLRSDPPDVVVADTLVPAGGLAAQLLRVPWVELIPHHLPDPAADLPPVGLGRRPARTWLRRLDDGRIHHAQLRSLRVSLDQAHTAARAAGLDARRPAVVRLVATLPTLERPRAVWPPDAHVVGPLAVDPASPPLAPPDGDEPLVVVTDSTAQDIDRRLGEVALAALTDVPVRVVVTSSSLPACRLDRRAVGTGPHGALLQQAALAVGPGGGGFVSKALTAGVPLVVVPLAGDQREAAARLRDSGVARVVPPYRLTPRSLRWTILRQLADRPARAAAAELAREASALGAGIAAALVARVAAGERPTADGPAQHLPDGERGPKKS